jgi:hypothetical protein
VAILLTDVDPVVKTVDERVGATGGVLRSQSAVFIQLKTGGLRKIDPAFFVAPDKFIEERQCGCTGGETQPASRISSQLPGHFIRCIVDPIFRFMANDYLQILNLLSELILRIRIAVNNFTASGDLLLMSGKKNSFG